MPEKTAKRVAKLNKMTDEEVHEEYNDFEIHQAMKVDAGLIEHPGCYTPGWRLVHDYSAEEKRAIILKHYRLYPTDMDEAAFKMKWHTASDNKVHQVYSDGVIRQMRDQCITAPPDLSKSEPSSVAASLPDFERSRKKIDVPDKTSSVDEVD